MYMMVIIIIILCIIKTEICKRLFVDSKQCNERLEFSLILKKEYEYIDGSQFQDRKSTSIGQYQTVFTKKQWVGLWEKVVSYFVLWQAYFKIFFAGHARPRPRPRPRPKNKCKYLWWNENYVSEYLLVSWVYLSLLFWF